MINWLPPAFIFLLGVAILPFLKGRVRQAYLLGLPVLAFLNLLRMTKGTHFVFDFLGQEMIFARVDKLSMAFGYIFVIMAFIGAVYSIHLKEKGEHIAAFLYLGSALGVVFAGDFLSLFVFWEIMAVASTYVIVGRRSKQALSAGYRYFLVHVVGGLLLFAGIMLQVAKTGSLKFDLIGLHDIPSLFILLGFALNAAIPPLSAWLPDAYPEATVTGAVFLSAYTTKTAVYVLIRGFQGTEILIWTGAIMAFYGVVYAVLVNDIRRILAYHIISQVGFMVAGVGIGTELAINGAVAHAFAHILYKGLLFMGAGAVLYETGKSKLSELGGLYKKMPITVALYMVGAFSISAFPLFSGFVSKSMVTSAAGEEHLLWIWGLLTISSAGTFLHTGLKLPWFTWFGKDAGLEAQEPPKNMLAAMGLASFACILIGVFPIVLYRLLPFEAEYVPYTASHVVWQLQYLLFTGLGFFVMLSHLKGEPYVVLDTDWFYIKGSPVLQSVAQVFSRANDGFEAATGKIVPAIMSLRRPLDRLNDLLARLLFAVFVDMWLFKPVTPPVAEVEADESETGRKKKKETHIVEDMARLGEKTSVLVGKIDLKVIDNIIGQFARAGAYISRLAGLFDLKVIDGIVNGFAWLTQKVGRGLRPTQSGDVQSYGTVMVGGAFLVMFFFIMVFYGVLKLA